MSFYYHLLFIYLYLCSEFGQYRLDRLCGRLTKTMLPHLHLANYTGGGWCDLQIPIPTAVIGMIRQHRLGSPWAGSARFSALTPPLFHAVGEGYRGARRCALLRVPPRPLANEGDTVRAISRDSLYQSGEFRVGVFRAPSRRAITMSMPTSTSSPRAGSGDSRNSLMPTHSLLAAISTAARWRYCCTPCAALWRTGSRRAFSHCQTRSRVSKYALRWE